MAASFRKIDVDAYDEDVLLETELYDPDPRGPQQGCRRRKSKSCRSQNFTRQVSHHHLRRPRAAYRVHRIRGDTVGALVTILDNAPYGPNVDEAKVTTDELGMLLSLTVLRSRISRCRRS
jgi:actin related protein 2/3 complex subunit 5